MIYDAIVIGGGPAGISAALTLRNRNKSVAVVANSPESTSLWKAEYINNYPGIKGTGAEIEKVMIDQAVDAGVEFLKGPALSVIQIGNTFGVAVQNEYYESYSVIVCVGITRESSYSGENEFIGKGVSYCATCDGMLYKGKTVAVVGTNKESEEDSKFLESIGCNVIKIAGTRKLEIIGEEKVSKIKYNNEEFNVDGVFIIKDSISVSKLINGLNYENKKILVDEYGKTNIKGIFAAGDCTGKPLQLSKAVGEGNVAAISANEYIENSKNM